MLTCDKGSATPWKVAADTATGAYNGSNSVQAAGTAGEQGPAVRGVMEGQSEGGAHLFAVHLDQVGSHSGQEATGTTEIQLTQ